MLEIQNEIPEIELRGPLPKDFYQKNVDELEKAGKFTEVVVFVKTSNKEFRIKTSPRV